METVERFFNKIKIPEDRDNDCWIWTAGTADDHGYFWDGSSRIYAHRYMYQLMHGDLPDYGSAKKNIIYHTCGNPLCVNPAHLRLGFRATGKWNPHGEKNPQAKATEKQVLKIRKEYASGLYTQDTLAKRYNLAQMTISCIVRRKTWTHI